MFFDWTTFISELYPQKYTGHCVLALWKAHQFEWLQTVENKTTQEYIVQNVNKTKNKTAKTKSNQIKSYHAMQDYFITKLKPVHWSR